MKRFAIALLLVCLFAVGFLVSRMNAAADEKSATGSNHLANAFASGWMLTDTNGDGLADAIEGAIVVPRQSTSTQNAAAANWAARLAFGSSGLTLPLVVTSAEAKASEPHVWIGKEAAPADDIQAWASVVSGLEKGEGGVFEARNGLVVMANDDAGLAAAADSFSARAPYLWDVPGSQFSAINEAIKAPGSTVEIVGVTYGHGKQGIRRVFLRASGEVPASALAQALTSPRLSAVHELVVLGGTAAVSAVNPKPMTDVPATKEESEKPVTETPDAEAEEEEVLELDLSTLYTSKGLFKGSPKTPLPSSLKAHLYVPGGVSGVAIANLAARIGLEGTGITLPLASAAEQGTSQKVKTPAVLASKSPLVDEATKKLRDQETAGGASPVSLAPGEGEAVIVDNAFKKNGAVLVRGDEAGSVAALNLLSAHFPNVWETGKQYLSLENMRYDLHRFFSLHSAAGQATDAVFLLDRWAKELAVTSDGSGVRDVRAEVYVDIAAPGLDKFVQKAIEDDLHGSSVEVTTGSLHAGTQCCDADPDLHYQTPEFPFRQAKPTFSEDIAIPWEGTRLLEAVRGAASKIASGQNVTLVARVSEGPEERQKLKNQLEDILTHAGANRSHLNIEVLSAYKQGYSWLVDEIVPALEGKSLAALNVSFARNIDPTDMEAMSTSARWVQELYPVDEVIAKDLNIPLNKITFAEFTPGADDPTYKVVATDARGAEILSRAFQVKTASQPYNSVMPEYEQVKVETGWVYLESGSRTLLDERIKTDIETFWERYQGETLPRIHKFIMAQTRGEIRPEYQPLFDTLRLDIHMSEPDYNIGIDKERISSLEALQEDTFYITGNFIDMMGNLEAGHSIDYPGRIIPIVHASEDGKDGHVHIDFYGKPAANPLVRLTWTDAQGVTHERERNLPALQGPLQPRLIEARVKDGVTGIENLTWSLPADFLHDDYGEWTKVELRDRVEHTVFAVERGEGQMQWLERMHSTGLYRDELAYPYLEKLTMRFDLPRSLDADVEKPSPAAYASMNISSPAHARPMITDYAGRNRGTPIVQWDEPITPDENAAILARLATYPGVNAYWMGRSYLGQNIWAADIMLPSPSALRSWAKETTLKSSVIYSGRQHANEVSSTSHVDKLGELLVTDERTRDLLRQVNVVLHPIDNTDGAQLSVELARITPDNLLHPGYHGSLSADVSEGRKETDPIYPESRTRPLLIRSWLPDAFLNPHGYPSHEWVQPFSDYTGWVIARQADAGREWWIPRGWFTSLDYLRDAQHPYGEDIAYSLRDRIVEAEREVPGLLPLETRMNARYQRFGQQWGPRYMVQPVVGGIRIYMALKGSPADSEEISGDGISPDVTWDSGYTEAPDETAHGDYMKLVASAGLAFDMVHLNYLAHGKLRIVRTQKSGPDGVEWKLDRKRPILPSSEPPIPPIPAD